MAYFQAKRHWERPQKSENKNFRSGHFLPICNRKLKKLANTIMAYCPTNPGWERQRKSKKKKLSFRSFPTRTQIEI